VQRSLATGGAGNVPLYVNSQFYQRERQARRLYASPALHVAMLRLLMR
jgi:hypothetical protein